jgi:cysteine synthase B
MMNILDHIGNTPLVEIKRLHNNPNVKIYAKLEGQNPGGSVKDRPAYNMINEALARGDIKKGSKLVEATSGNTGIALAMIACAFGLDMTLVMPDNSTIERVQTMRAYGATVVLTPAEKTIEYSREYAENLVKNEGYYMLNQFENPDNWGAHFKTTGPEIWDKTNGEITHFVATMGTTGTIMGVSRFLKSLNDTVQIVGVQPTEGSNIPGIRRWSPEFLPKIYEPFRVDQIIDVSTSEAVDMARRLAKEESIFAGTSSGGSVTAALRLAAGLEKGIIVCIICDRGDRYLSAGIFE